MARRLDSTGCSLGSSQRQQGRAAVIPPGPTFHETISQRITTPMRPVALIALDKEPARKREWDLGPRVAAEMDPGSVSAALRNVDADAVLCLDAAFPTPEPGVIERLLGGPGDVWHAGLRLGLDGHPRALQHVRPQWMLTAHVDAEIESTSPRISLRALLVRSSVIEQLGGPDPDMETLSGAGIELGIRWTRAGALVRHVPALAPHGATPDAAPPEVDGLRCISRHHGRSWAYWALGRSVAQREVRLRSVPPLVRAVRRAPPSPTPHFRTEARPTGDPSRSVSVILPTVDRYSYLEPLLDQLSHQTRPPHEVIVVDQTPEDRRHDLGTLRTDLPMTVLTLDEPGQSTARNMALRAAAGEFVLFIDDDDEIGDSLIEDHLRRLTDGIDAICGGVDDATSGPPPPGFQHRRCSDVFPTNNTMLRREALHRSGLFDPVFDHGPRADHDLGIRLHLGGALLVYDPSVMVFHHHAPVGGLRTHGARVTTRASARDSLIQRNLPAPTEIYIGLRYFPDREQHEAKVVRTIATLTGGTTRARRLLRAAIQILLLPGTVAAVSRASTEARAMFAARTPIPRLEPSRLTDRTR